MTLILRCFHNAFCFHGRARRAEYWTFLLFCVVGNMILASLGAMVHSHVPETVFSLAVFCPLLAVSVRRLHDIGFSGWWVLVALVPFVGSLGLFCLCAIDSQRGCNVYGNSEKYPDIEEWIREDANL